MYSIINPTSTITPITNNQNQHQPHHKTNHHKAQHKQQHTTKNHARFTTTNQSKPSALLSIPASW
jgi:hypothetical protein